METKKNKILRRADFIVQNTSDVNSILLKIFSAGILTRAQYQTIDSKTNDDEKIVAICFIASNHPKGYDVLLNALRSTNNAHVADEIEQPLSNPDDPSRKVRLYLGTSVRREEPHSVESGAESENTESEALLSTHRCSKKQKIFIMTFVSFLAVSTAYLLFVLFHLPAIHAVQERNLTGSNLPTENLTIDDTKWEYLDRATEPDSISTSTQKSFRTEFARIKTMSSVPDSTQLAQATVDFSTHLHHYRCNKTQTLELVLNGVSDGDWLSSYLSHCNRRSTRVLTVSGPVTKESLDLILSSNLRYSLEFLYFNDTTCESFDFDCSSNHNLSPAFVHLGFNNTKGGCGDLYKYIRICVNKERFVLSYSNSEILDSASGSELCGLERESGNLMRITNTTGFFDCIQTERIN